MRRFKVDTANIKVSTSSGVGELLLMVTRYMGPSRARPGIGATKWYLRQTPHYLRIHPRQSQPSSCPEAYYEQAQTPEETSSPEMG